jgi:hypothetical protein
MIRKAVEEMSLRTFFLTCLTKTGQIEKESQIKVKATSLQKDVNLRKKTGVFHEATISEGIFSPRPDMRRADTCLRRRMKDVGL